MANTGGWRRTLAERRRRIGAGVGSAISRRHGGIPAPCDVRQHGSKCFAGSERDNIELYQFNCWANALEPGAVCAGAVWPGNADAAAIDYPARELGRAASRYANRT